LAELGIDSAIWAKAFHTGAQSHRIIWSLKAVGLFSPQGETER
jgi:hypothetical protein